MSSLLPQEGDDEVVLVDEEDGNVLDPSMEASVLMALDFPELVHCTAKEAGFMSEKERAADEAEKGEIGEEIPLDEEEERVEEGMGSRAHTWDRQESEELHIESIVRRSKFQGVECYLVKYRGHEEPLWETTEFLLEEGHKPLLDAFRDARTSSAQSQRVRERDIGKLQSKVMTSLHQRYTAVSPKGAFNIFDHYPNLVNLVVRRFEEVLVDEQQCRRVHSLNMIPHTSDGPLDAFTKEHKKGAHHSVEVLFHGTRKVNFDSVCNRGLLVPGNDSGIRVANGSALGVGIYSAKKPGVPFNYCRDCNEMFVLAGLIGPTVTVSPNHSGDICVFFNQALVVPIAIVSFSEQKEPPTKILLGVRGESNTFEYVTSPPLPRALPGPTYPPRVGPKTRGEGVETRFKFMTKRELRAAPRRVKEQFKEGLVLHPKH